MPTSRIRTLALAFTASMTVCAHDAPTGSHVSTNDLDATWSTIATILCRLIRFTLTVSDTTITGTGSFSVDAGRGGALTVTGARSGTAAAERSPSRRPVRYRTTRAFTN